MPVKASPFQFNYFYKLYKKHYPNVEMPSQDFLEGLVGFTEGGQLFHCK